MSRSIVATTRKEEDELVLQAMDEEEWGYQASYSKLGVISEEKGHVAKMAKLVPDERKAVAVMFAEQDRMLSNQVCLFQF